MKMERSSHLSSCADATFEKARVETPDEYPPLAALAEVLPQAVRARHAESVATGRARGALPQLQPLLVNSLASCCEVKRKEKENKESIFQRFHATAIGHLGSRFGGTDDLCNLCKGSAFPRAQSDDFTLLRIEIFP